MLKLVAMDRLHAECINAREDIDSIICGKAVILDIDGKDDRLPGMIIDAIGYTEDCTEWDVREFKKVYH